MSASVGTAAGTPKAKLKLSAGFTRTRDGFLIKKEAVSDSGGVRTYLGLPFPLSAVERPVLSPIEGPVLSPA
ncbi:hypothetical protein sS8_0159 [Methylocaldum marinum]|uniref:Uncharacterized protein n=1 Tax=Methylocaldum marinum TaxID=1432792 RepID=A0A286P3A5_9GAMM|nr:hypothetical protein sS8_0159 [Methylocaldum marinum]